jgi:hypothetical protein
MLAGCLAPLRTGRILDRSPGRVDRVRRINGEVASR